MRNDDRYELWFLTGSQALYGEDTLQQVAYQSRCVAEQLVTALGERPVRIVWKPILTDAAAIRRGIAALGGVIAEALA